MPKKVVIVGAGISGLTAAAYLSKEGFDVTLLEKSETLGGLIGSFTRDGFTYDHGIRGVENSGTLFPMLKQLGIELTFLPNVVDMGIGDDIVSIHPAHNYGSYKEQLKRVYPDNTDEIEAIFKDIQKVSKYMEVLYDIDNPLFLDPKTDAKYLMKTILPWMFKYTFTIGKIEKLKTPIRLYLSRYTQNSDLIDAICQHFFTDTPSFFALSYLKMHSDYYYPLGGTQSIVLALKAFILKHGGKIKTECEVDKIDVDHQIAYHKDLSFPYDALLWCGDLNAFYRSVSNTSIDFKPIQNKLRASNGNDSLFQLYLAVDLPSDYFKSKFSGHLFYMPTQKGLSRLTVDENQLIDVLEKQNPNQQKTTLTDWLSQFARYTTYEISVPVCRDLSLAPENQSAVIISTLFGYRLSKWLKAHHLDTFFRHELSNQVIETLDKTLFHGWKSQILHSFDATPLTIENRLNNTGGAITGWSFSHDIPVENKLFKIAKSIQTPFSNIYQSSQWSFSPSGFPTSIVTAKIASDRIKRLLKK